MGRADGSGGGSYGLTVTVITAGGFCAFPLSSTARLLIVTVPMAVGVQVKLQEPVPVARFHVAPPSTDTFTPATKPPPFSVAAPVMLTGVPTGKLAPAVGDVIVATGA